MIVSALHLAPAATPAPVVTRLNAAINASRAAPELRASLAKLGYEPKRTSPEKFAEFLAVEMRKWPPIVQAAGLKAD